MSFILPSMHNLEIAELEGRPRSLVQLFHFTEKESEAQRDQIELEVTLVINGKV